MMLVSQCKYVKSSLEADASMQLACLRSDANTRIPNCAKTEQPVQTDTSMNHLQLSRMPSDRSPKDISTPLHRLRRLFQKDHHRAMSRRRCTATYALVDMAAKELPTDASDFASACVSAFAYGFASALLLSWI